MRFTKVDVNKLRGVADKGMRGVADKSVGLGKEMAGLLLGNERLERDGASRQRRAATELKAFGKEVRTQAAHTRRRARVQRQRLSERISRSA